MNKSHDSKKIYVKFSLFFYCIVLITASIVHSAKGGQFIMSDGASYYRYLPEFFINHNFHYYNKYPIGTALSELPFFLIGCMISVAFNLNISDGTATIFQLLINLCGMFYYCIGSFFLYKALSSLYKEKIAHITLFFISLGTFLYVYAAAFSSFSHIYSYAFISVFIYMIVLQKTRTIIENFIFGVVLSIIFLIRNEDIVVALVYLLAFEKNKNSWRKHFRTVFSGKTLLPKFAGAIFVLIPQLVIWYMAFGKFVTYSYGNESFLYASRPKFLEVLFSDAKGLFIFSPILIFSVFGLFVIKVTPAKRYTFGILLVIFLKLYIVAAWWCWWLGCGIGTRSFINILPLFAVLMGAFFYYIFETTSQMTRKEKNFILGFFALFASFFSLINIRMYVGEVRGEISNNLATYYQLKNAFWKIKQKICSVSLDDKIYFYGSQNSARNFISKGLSGSERDFTWTEEKKLELKARLENFVPEKRIWLICDCLPFNGNQRVNIVINNSERIELTVNEDNPLVFSFMPSKDGMLLLEFDLPDARSPKELGMSGDTRKLGLAISSITFTQVPIDETIDLDSLYENAEDVLL